MSKLHSTMSTAPSSNSGTAAAANPGSGIKESPTSGAAEGPPESVASAESTTWAVVGIQGGSRIVLAGDRDNDGSRGIHVVFVRGVADARGRGSELGRCDLERRGRDVQVR